MYKTACRFMQRSSGRNIQLGTPCQDEKGTLQEILVKVTPANIKAIKNNTMALAFHKAGIGK